MASKAAISAMELERRRGLLIPKKEVTDVVSYALVCFRQRTLLSYRAITQQLVTRNLVATENAHAVGRVILEEAHSLLNELGRMLPDAANPEFALEELERRELGLEKEKERQQTPGDHKQRQARIEKRRSQKTEAKRRERARKG
jgi:hypothetical protein